LTREPREALNCGNAVRAFVVRGRAHRKLTKVLSGSAAHALATEHLNETCTSSLLPCLVVAALICRSIVDHLRLPLEPERQPAAGLVPSGHVVCQSAPVPVHGCLPPFVVPGMHAAASRPAAFPGGDPVRDHGDASPGCCQVKDEGPAHRAALACLAACCGISAVEPPRFGGTRARIYSSVRSMNNPDLSPLNAHGR